MQYAQPYDQPLSPNAPYVDGNPATGTQGSVIPAAALEQDQREIVAAIVGAGITPSGNDLTQLYQAILVGGYCVATGTANALTGALGTAPGAYRAGMTVRMKITASNTGPATVNINGLGVQTIVNRSGGPLIAGDLLASSIVTLQYDGTNFQLGGTGSGTGSGSTFYGVDSGTANAVVTTIATAPTVISPGLEFFIKKGATANTGPMTVTINALGPYAIINADGSTIASGEMGAGYLMNLVFDGTSMRFLNGATTTAVGSLTANAGEGINVDGSGVVSLNIPGLSAPVASVGSTDLFPFQSIADGHARALTLAQLMSALPASLANITTYTTPGTFTWTKATGTRSVIVFATGSGGGGGGAAGSDSQCGAGGGAGGTAMTVMNAVPLSTVAVTVGAGALGGFQSGNSSSNGKSGNVSSFGTFAAANGGGGGQGNNTAVQSFGGLGGTATAGNLLMRGNGGINGSTSSGGGGGGSFWGGAGQGIAYFNNSGSGNGFDGLLGGGGGAGDNQGSGSVTGGNGGGGCVVVLEFA